MFFKTQFLAATPCQHVIICDFVTFYGQITFIFMFDVAYNCIGMIKHVVVDSKLVHM